MQEEKQVGEKEGAVCGWGGGGGELNGVDSNAVAPGAAPFEGQIDRTVRVREGEGAAGPAADFIGEGGEDLPVGGAGAAIDCKLILIAIPGALQVIEGESGAVGEGAEVDGRGTEPSGLCFVAFKVHQHKIGSGGGRCRGVGVEIFGGNAPGDGLCGLVAVAPARGKCG